MMQRSWVEPNIGPLEVRKRLIRGFVSVLLTLAVLSSLLLTTSNRWLRLGMLPLYFVSALYFFQTREKTCVALARRGQCKFSRDIALVSDATKQVRIARQMRRVYWHSWLTALLTTLITLTL